MFINTNMFVCLCTLLSLFIMVSHTTYQLSVRLQKGTYSNINLCKNGIPTYLTSARSLIECLGICQTLLRKNCKSFKYEKQMNHCSLYNDFILYDYKESVNGSCFGYQIIPDCPEGFKYLLEGNKCVTMQIGTWNFSEARTECNKLHPLSHPVILNVKGDALLFSLFCQTESGLVSKCINTMNTKLSSYWTAGISPYVLGIRKPFQWQPFPNASKLLELTTPWNPGQPNSLNDGILNCMMGHFGMGIDDNLCSLGLCALCQIDMP